MGDGPATVSKAVLRKQALAVRDGIAMEARALAAARLARFAEGLEIAAGTIVAGYFPIRSEIDPRPLMAALAAKGVRLCLPVVAADRETLIFRAFAAETVLEPSSFGLSVPGAREGELEPQVLLMPLAAFDGAGNRLGYGKGHYDRALERLEATGPRRKIGLAFSAQRVDTIPAEPHDRPLDLILTEDGPVGPRADQGGDAA